MPLYDNNTVNILNKIKDEDLIRFVYYSKLTLKSRFKPSIFHSLERDARKFNKSNGITGTLCYGSGFFLQCLEGKKKLLLPLVQAIFDDTRHENTQIMLIKPIQVRNFDNWGMRLMFLERWLWSPETKKQADTLSKFLPFRPYKWNTNETEEFLQAIQKIETPPHIKQSGITLNALGNMTRHIVGPHQAFILVQGVLSVFVIIAIVLLMQVPYY
ncbi:BLUF domain-containing protein [Psychrobacter sp.]|uniref:BLUF domain-containing protein n=1 Tax=Psychrobacter sp. TaxID=56811 RepID=UPI0025E70050|nr:BLUF domain-containing protein [Psychrobacter sp.]